MPFFSTVIPVFNRADLIRPTLDSVIAQDFRDHEIIVIDDGSTDDTLKALATYSSVRVLSQKNSGPAVARNLGIAHAAGKYITILDSDDLWFPWTLATYAEAIERFDSPAFLAGSPFVFSDENEVRAIRRDSFKAERFFDYFASGNQWRWFSASSFVLRADAVRAVGGFSTEWINSDDADLALRLGQAEGFVDIQAPATFAYRDHSGSLKSKSDVSLRSIDYMISQEKSGAYPGGAKRRRERLEILTRHIRPFTFECLRDGAISNAWSVYRKTFAWHLMLRRASYLAAFPLLAATHAIRRRKAAA